MNTSKSILSLSDSSICRDTLHYVSKQEITDLYKTLLETEQANHTLFITFLLGLIAILLGFTWWWNKHGAEKYIKNEVESLVQKTMSLKGQELEQSMKNTIALEFEKKTEEYRIQILQNELNLNRVMAFTLQKNKIYSASVSWWAESLKIAIKLNEGRYIRAFTDEIIDELRILKEAGKTKVYKLKSLQDLLAIMPEALFHEKEKIQEYIKGLEGSLDDATKL